MGYIIWNKELKQLLLDYHNRLNIHESILKRGKVEDALFLFESDMTGRSNHYITKLIFTKTKRKVLQHTSIFFTNTTIQNLEIETKT